MTKECTFWGYNYSHGPWANATLVRAARADTVKVKWNSIKLCNDFRVHQNQDKILFTSENILNHNHDIVCYSCTSGLGS